jgi:hypothetical protein
MMKIENLQGEYVTNSYYLQKLTNYGFYLHLILKKSEKISTYNHINNKSYSWK